MDYSEAIEFLNSLVDYEKLGFRREFGQKVNLDSMTFLAESLGNPQDDLRMVHIAGTKGKGSVAALVEAITRAAGYKTGLFTSPHLVSPRERIRVNGSPLSRDEMIHLVEQVRPTVARMREDKKLTSATFFEVYTAMCFIHFARENVDLAVIETGLGGRLDSTNIITPLACAITTLGLDHTKVLGDTIEEIAAEKAGIIKPDIPVVVAPNAPEADVVVTERAKQLNAPVVRPPEVIEVKPPRKIPVPDEAHDSSPPVQQVTLQHDDGAVTYDLSLLGPHQATNFSVAVGIVDVLNDCGYEISREDIATGAADIRWPGRLQIMDARPWIVTDCAHNAQSAAALAEALPPLLEYDRLIVILGISREKDAAAVARALAPITDVAVLTQARIQRAMPVDILKVKTQHEWKRFETTRSVIEAVEGARKTAGPRDCILVTGSFYVVGEFLECVYHERK
ncbi:MAG: folylpolyglutamate synthase/dihydrofolate synthase family protein [Armatimonadota bacterium]